MYSEQLVMRARAIAEFTAEMQNEILFIERLNREIDEDTSDYEKERRRELLEKAKVMCEVIEWLVK